MFAAFKDPAQRVKAFGITAVVGLGVIAAGYWVYRAKQRVNEGKCPFTGKGKQGAHENKACPHSTGKLSGEEQYNDLKLQHLQRIVSIKRDIMKQSSSETLDYANLTAIQEIVVEVTVKHLRPVLKVQREKRRKITDKQKYEEEMQSHFEQVEDIFKANLHAALLDFSVSKDKYEASMEKHVSLDPTVCMTGTHLYRVLVSRMGSVVAPELLTSEKTKEILEFMIEEYPKITFTPAHLSIFAEVKEAMLLDKVHQRFDFEEEDLQALRRKHNNAETKALVEKLETEIMHDIEHRLHYLKLD